MEVITEIFTAMGSEYAMANVYPYWVAFAIIVVAFLAIDTRRNRR